MPPALVATEPPIWLESAAAQSTGYSSPAAAALRCSSPTVRPAWAVRLGSASSSSTIWRILSSDTTTSPLAATAPPDRPVRPPLGTSFSLFWRATATISATSRSEEHTSELQSRGHIVCRLLLEKKQQ